jgi:hypothetical protein
MQRLAEDTAVAPIPDEDEAGPEILDENPASPGTLLLLAVLWLGATLWSAHATIAGNALSGAVAVSSAALALPSVCAATLLTGAAAGLAASVLVARRRALPPRWRRRVLLGAAAGAVCGLVTGGLIMFGYGAGSAVVILAATVAAAGLIGGALAALPVHSLYSGIAATLAVSAAGVALNLFQAPLKSAMGAGDTAASRLGAAELFSLSHGVVSGLVAGVVAYLILRYNGLTHWPLYLLAGAIPGLLALVAEALTQIGGAGLLRLVSTFSDNDRGALAYLRDARISHALIVMFVGGIIATVAYGRTLKRPSDPSPAEASADAGTDE